MATTENQTLKASCPTFRKPGRVAADTVLLSGTLTYVDAATGFITTDDNSGANKFFGVTPETFDNTGGAAGEIDCEVYSEGIFYLPGTGFNQASVGKSAHGTDNYTVALTGGSVIGVIAEYVSPTEVGVKIDA